MSINSMHTRLAVVAAFVVFGCFACAAAASEAPPPNPFFAYCVGIGAEKESASLSAQKELPPMLAELGYAGMAYVGLDGAIEMRDALEKHGQKLFAVYTSVNIDPGNRGYDPRLKDLIPKLAGHGTVVWLTVESGKWRPSTADGDRRAVELLRDLADAAGKHGVAVSLYPHLGCYAQRIEDVVRLAKKANRPNLGVTFTFCHFLALHQMKNLDSALALARPYLNMATINGTDGYDPKDLAGWIKVLGEGSVDVGSLLAGLRKIDYRGPIGMMAYGIHGDRRDILTRSIQGWRELSAAQAEEGFTSIFNGKDLTGWDGKFANWCVADGAITGESSPQRPCAKCNYLFWRGGKPADFECAASIAFPTWEIPASNSAAANCPISTLPATKPTSSAARSIPLPARFTTATAGARSHGAARSS